MRDREVGRERERENGIDDIGRGRERKGARKREIERDLGEISRGRERDRER